MDIKQISPLGLAYIGDCVYELLVRERLLNEANVQVSKLHKRTVAIVCATAQAKAMDIIYPILTEDEEVYFKRGRNTGSSVPKSSNVHEYRRATGLEALFGYLHLTGQTNRINELFEMIFRGLNEE